jgi:nitrite reductase/ring-hydroxylating ferredoxin subunit
VTADPSQTTSAPGAGFERVATLEDIPAGALLAVSRGNGEQVCLFNHEGRIGAMSDLCTHQAFPMSAGSLEPDGTVECSWHGARFDCLTGEVRRGPALDSIAIYEVRVDGHEVWLGPSR